MAEPETLIYQRSDEDHVWRTTDGEIALWQGASAWYYRPDYTGRTARLCALDWPDGDAIRLYRAFRRIHERRRDATHENP